MPPPKKALIKNLISEKGVCVILQRKGKGELEDKIT